MYWYFENNSHFYGDFMGYTTGKRERILEFMSSNADASFTLEEICERLLTDGHGKSTVYRIVSELVGDGRIKRLSDGRTRKCTYQFVGGESCHEHLHLKCKGCGKMLHLDEKISHKLVSEVLRAGGFLVEEGTFLFGTCRECAGVKI